MPKTKTKEKAEVKSSTKKKHILWIEDDFGLVALYKTMIGTMPGIELEVITLGTIALQRIKEIEAGIAEKPDLVMLDLLLPDGINGDKILEVMRQNAFNKRYPSIYSHQLWRRGNGKRIDSKPECRKVYD